MAKYKYFINISRLGGEHTIGTISRKVANYWLDEGPDKFEEYIFSNDWGEDKEELNKSIPEEFQINEYWNDMDDIDHINGAEYSSSNFLIVRDISDNPDPLLGKEIGEYSIEDIPIEKLSDPANDAMKNNDDITNGDIAIIYGQSFEKGAWDYEVIETNEPFDIFKLKLSITQWDSLKIVTDIHYDDKVYCNDSSDTTTKSTAFWIDD